MRIESSSERDARRVAELEVWAKRGDVDLACLDLGQQWVVFAALQLIAFFDAVPALKRLVG